jgi:hypothetical protein
VGGMTAPLPGGPSKKKFLESHVAGYQSTINRVFRFVVGDPALDRKRR